MIPISKPIIAKNARKYLLECLKSNWISGAGPYVARFEADFAKFCGTKYAVATNSGTTALHLALVSLNIGRGDEVIVPAFTMIASILPVIYTGATPVLVDVEKETGNLDVTKLEEKISKKTKAIMVVHIYGHPADMAPILDLAKKYNLAIIEDAAEAHGAEYQLPNGSWEKTGSIGHIGCFSLYANKIVTAGEGGMITTNNKRLAEKMKSLSNQDRNPNRHFFHQEIAFAYRLSNLQAALGVAQLEEIDNFLKKKRQIASLYSKLLSQIPYLELPLQKNYAKSVFWQYGIIIKKGSPLSRNELADILKKQHIETRTFFIPLHLQPVFKKRGLFTNEKYPVSEDLSKKGLCLPAGLAITDKDINHICQIIIQAFK